MKLGLSAEVSPDDRGGEPGSQETDPSPASIVMPVRSKSLHILHDGDASLCRKSEFLKQFRLEEQYSLCRDLLMGFGFIEHGNEHGLPDLIAVFNELSRIEFETASKFNDPSLIIMPETSLASKIDRIDSNLNSVKRYSGFTLSYHTDMNISYSDCGEGTDAPSGWRVAVAEGAPEMDMYEWDKPKKDLSERIRLCSENRARGERFVDPQIYAMLIMRAMKRGIPMDQMTNSIFPTYNPHPESETHVPRVFRARWDAYSKAPHFDWTAPMSVDEKARFRPYVGGRLIK